MAKAKKQAQSEGQTAGPSGSNSDASQQKDDGSVKRNWGPYNEWDREFFESNKVRPNVREAEEWYKLNQDRLAAVNGGVPPPLAELKIHRGRFRADTSKTRGYTNKRRAEKRETEKQLKAQAVKAKAVSLWKKVPALVRMLTLRREAQQCDKEQYMSFLQQVMETFQKKTFKARVLAMMALQRMRVAGEQAFLNRIILERPPSPLTLALAEADSMESGTGEGAGGGAASGSGVDNQAAPSGLQANPQA